MTKTKSNLYFVIASFLAAVINYLIILLVLRSDSLLAAWNAEMSISNLILSALGGFTLYFTNQVVLTLKLNPEGVVNYRLFWIRALKSRVWWIILIIFIISLATIYFLSLKIGFVIAAFFFLFFEVLLLFNQGYLLGKSEFQYAGTVILFYSICKFIFAYLLTDTSMTGGIYLTSFAMAACFVYLLSIYFVKKADGHFKPNELNLSPNIYAISMSVIALLATNYIMNVVYLVAYKTLNVSDTHTFAPLFNLGQIIMFASLIILPILFNKISHFQTQAVVFKSYLQVMGVFILASLGYYTMNTLSWIPRAMDRFNVDINLFGVFTIFVWSVVTISFLVQAMIALNHFKRILSIFICLVVTSIILYIVMFNFHLSLESFLLYISLAGGVNVIFIIYQFYVIQKNHSAIS